MHDKSLHILIIASWYPKMNDLSGIFVKEQAEMLFRNGYKVTVLHPYLKGTFYNSLKTRKSELNISDEDGIQVIRIAVSPFMPFFKSFSYLKLVKQVEHSFDFFFSGENIPDIIHSHALFMGGVVAYKLSKKHNIPFVHTEHTSGLVFNPESYSYIDIALLKKVYSFAQKVIFVSEFVKNKLTENYNQVNQNFVVIHNVVHSSFFTALLESETQDPLRFIIICNLFPVKDLDLLIDSWKLFVSQFPQAKLTIAGDGPLKNKLKDKVVFLNIEDSVIWLNTLSRIEVINQIDLHDVLLSTSKIETFGMTVAEAIGRGKPVVSTNSGGVIDIITHETGLIVDRHPEAFSKGMAFMKMNYQNFQPSHLQKYAYNKFSETRIYSQLHNLYSSILKNEK